MEPPSFVRAAVCLLHLAVAAAIFRRARLVRLVSPQLALRALPALVIAGLAFRFTAPLGTWPLALEILFGFGAALAFISFGALGQSFSVLPAERGVVSHGPYRYVRHPAYAGELLMVLACVLAQPTETSVAVLALAVPFVALRIQAEERVLSHRPEYRRYTETVPYRVMPCLW